jgi:anti-sigma regulatory factor (Ser/Thr protein kinase)
MIGPRVAGRRRRFEASFSDAFIFSITGGPEAPGHARHGLANQVNGSLDAAALEKARLLVSELVTNCVQHAGTPADEPIEVAGSLHRDALRVEVTSIGPAFDHQPTKPSPSSARGRGLFLVETLAREWGVTSSDGRTGVWFEIARA